MQLKAETRHLVEKHAQRLLRPAEIFFCAVLSVVVFGLVHKSRCSYLRYDNSSMANALALIVALFVLLVFLVARTKYTTHRPVRSWCSMAVILPCTFFVALVLGDRYWWKSLMSVYTWPDMAGYVNIDPDRDRGQSFMDAGTVYFHDGAYVLKTHSIAFRNGRTYCVAPIVRAAPNATHLQTENGFAMPRSGSVDFWAVGVDCCGEKGSEFHCGDAGSTYARAGLRALDEIDRSMFLLGVQEWSATTGLPVKHPLFFQWIMDPIGHREELLATAETVFTGRLVECFFISLIAIFAVHVLLQRLRVN